MSEEPFPITRIVVVDEDGAHEFWGDSWEFHLQDDDRTLKAFATGDGREAIVGRNTALAMQMHQLVDLDWTGRVTGPEHKEEKDGARSESS